EGDKGLRQDLDRSQAVSDAKKDAADLHRRHLFLFATRDRMAASAFELTRDLVRLRSINPPGDEAACARLIGGILEEAGFAVSSHSYGPGRANIVARLTGAGDKEPICFTGHMDTVPLGAAPWQRDPLAAERDGDKLYGRGSSDMKSGVAAMVAA